MGIPAMFKPMISQFLKGVEIKFDTENEQIVVTQGETKTTHGFADIERMVNEGQIDI